MTIALYTRLYTLILVLSITPLSAMDKTVSSEKADIEKIKAKSLAILKKEKPHIFEIDIIPADVLLAYDFNGKPFLKPIGEDNRLFLNRCQLNDLSGIAQIKVRYKGQYVLLKHIPRLCLIIEDNEVEELPAEIGELDLKYLSLIGNKLSTLPADLNKLTLLHELRLDNNRFKVWPKEVESMKALRILTLNDNQIA